MFRSRNKEHELNRNALPCLLDTISVFLWRTLPISALFQWVIGSLFSLYIFIFKVGNSDEAVGNTRNSTETKDDSAATYFNIYISQTFSAKELKIAEVGYFALSNILGSEVPCTKPLQTPYRPGPRFKFVTHRVGDEALVSVTGTT